eukprot:15099780-Alexandrium_andersonii.AAC.1
MGTAGRRATVLARPALWLVASLVGVSKSSSRLSPSRVIASPVVVMRAGSALKAVVAVVVGAL